MKTLTVRGIEPKLSELLKNFAKQEGKSVNQVIIDTLKKHFGLQKEKKYSRTYHDLDDLFGCWSQDDFLVRLRRLNPKTLEKCQFRNNNRMWRNTNVRFDNDDDIS